MFAFFFETIISPGFAGWCLKGVMPLFGITPLTCTHFAPANFSDFGIISPFYIGPMSRYTRFMVIFPSPVGKGQHGRSQRGTWARKPLVRGISLKVVLLARLLLLGGHTSSPPNNPLILRYFEAFWGAKFWKWEKLGATKPLSRLFFDLWNEYRK